jgi:hypothetical protein
VGKQHLDPLALATRLVEGGRVIEGSGDIAGVLMDVARDLAMRGAAGSEGEMNFDVTVVAAPKAASSSRTR